MSEKDSELSRRDFGKASLGATAGALATVTGGVAQAAPPIKKRSYAIVGVGSRSYMYQDAIHRMFPGTCDLVACVDTNPGRLQLAQDFARQAGRPEPKSYAAADFDRMVSETKPKTVIVTTVDGTHHQYIGRAMLAGCDVITEKPMTTEAESCRLILDVRKKTGKSCRVAFNYRYTPVRSQVKELLMSGLIGDVLSVDFHWMLDTSHGADYFRRWHSNKVNSGGLLVHKSTHHFDLVNWWLSGIPQRVSATGKRDFYTPAMAKRFGLQQAHERCHTCTEKTKCGFELSLLRDPRLKSLYLDQEKHDGYFRDRCVFRPDIDIEDTMNVQVSYDTGATLSYSLNAFMPWEGYVVTFNGTKGRLEHKMEESIVLDPNQPKAVKGDGTYLRVYPLRKPAYEIEPQTGAGGHGGGDPVMLRDLFAPTSTPDKLLRGADERSGAYSILTGVAANRSIVTQQPVTVADLVPDIGYPAYPKMPNHKDVLPMPLKR
ncbi:MAG: Gfo/Idh/MocA family oxidoreductase [Polyangiaceae bacterium]